MELIELRQNIAKVKENIDLALRRAGSDRRVILVGASKTMPSSVIDMVDSERLLDYLGENRAQELRDKYRDNQSFKWHYIGALQQNKIKYLANKVSLIESVDNIVIASELDNYADKHNTSFNILAQVNMGEEVSKSGFLPSQIDVAIEEISRLSHLNLQGIMVVMPRLEREELIELYKKVNIMYARLLVKYPRLEYLSAGMTNDYELAIEYGGANIVRIGRAIFGERTN